MNHLDIYSSVDEVIALAEKGPNLAYMNSGFFGVDNRAAAIKMVRYGGASRQSVEKAKRLFDKIDSNIGERMQGKYVPSVAGAYPCVPDYLMGMPEPMRQWQPVPVDNAPVRIYVEALVSGSVGPDALVNRGAAIVALVAKLQEVRPVELYVFGSAYLNNATVSYAARVNTPVSMETAMAIFGSREFYRAINFHYFYAMTGNTTRSIDWGLGSSPSASREEAIREAFNMNPQDIVLQGGYSTEEALMNRDPVAWVNKYLDAQRNLEA